MIIYSRYSLLKLLAENIGWGWVQTNEYGATGKRDLLRLRHEFLVQYSAGDSYRVEMGLKRQPHGPDRIANYYTITIKGFSKLLELFPENNGVQLMREKLFHQLFLGSKYWMSEIKMRSK